MKDDDWVVETAGTRVVWRVVLKVKQTVASLVKEKVVLKVKRTVALMDV